MVLRQVSCLSFERCSWESLVWIAIIHWLISKAYPRVFVQNSNINISPSVLPLPAGRELWLYHGLCERWLPWVVSAIHITSPQSRQGCTRRQDAWRLLPQKGEAGSREWNSQMPVLLPGGGQLPGPEPQSLPGERLPVQPGGAGNGERHGRRLDDAA